MTRSKNNMFMLLYSKENTIWLVHEALDQQKERLTGQLQFLKIGLNNDESSDVAINLIFYVRKPSMRLEFHSLEHFHWINQCLQRMFLKLLYYLRFTP